MSVPADTRFMPEHHFRGNGKFIGALLRLTRNEEPMKLVRNYGIVHPEIEEKISKETIASAIENLLLFVRDVSYKDDKNEEYDRCSATIMIKLLSQKKKHLGKSFWIQWNFMNEIQACNLKKKRIEDSKLDLAIRFSMEIISPLQNGIDDRHEERIDRVSYLRMLREFFMRINVQNRLKKAIRLIDRTIRNDVLVGRHEFLDVANLLYTFRMVIWYFDLVRFDANDEYKGTISDNTVMDAIHDHLEELSTTLTQITGGRSRFYPSFRVCRAVGKRIPAEHVQNIALRTAHHVIEGAPIEFFCYHPDAVWT